MPAARAPFVLAFGGNALLPDPFHPEQQEARASELARAAALVLERSGGLTPIPYDFDSTGIVDPPYARPSPKLGIRSVRTRLYRGRCQPDAELNAALDEFRRARDELYELLRREARIGKSEREKALRYIDDFFEIIDDPRRVKRSLIEKCS